MLKELKMLSGGMVCQGSHWTCNEMPGRLAYDAKSSPLQFGQHNRASHVRQRRTAVERIILAVISGGSFLCVALGAFVLFRALLP